MEAAGVSGVTQRHSPLLSTRSKPKGWLVLWLAYQHFPLSYTSAFTTIFEDEIELIFFENVLRLNQVQCNNRTSSGLKWIRKMKIKRYIVRKLELIIRLFFETKKIRWFVQRKINIYILRMDYKIDKKRKVFKEKYDSDNLLIQKYINIFLSLP